MVTDPYRKIASRYDRFFDSMNKGLKLVGLRLFRPKEGMNILDVGCGTGSHLELYTRYKCNLYGLDLSPSMLEVARERLADQAKLDLGDATQMPYENGLFDLVISMLTLHEMSPATRSAVLGEMSRVVKDSGRLLLIDFQPGPAEFYQGWTSRVIIFISELLAGREHFRNFRQFMRAGGLPGLLSENNMQVEKEKIVAGGTFNVMLVRRGRGE